MNFNFFKKKDFFIGFISGLILMAITSIVIGWTIAQHLNFAATKEVTQSVEDETGETKEDLESEDLTSGIINLIKSDDEISFKDMEVRGEDLKPAIVFKFSGNLQKDLSTDKMKKLFTVVPEIMGDLYWETPETLVLAANKALNPNTTYTVHLNTEVFKDLNIKISGQDKLQFTTKEAQKAQLVSVTPQNEVDLKSPLTFTFSEDVADYDIIGEDFKDDKIKFNPSVKGSYRWVNYRQFRFTPDESFQPATKYKVTLSPDIVVSKAFYLDDEQNVEFNTEEFKVLSSKMYLTNMGLRYDRLDAKLVFNQPVNPENLKKYLSINLLENGKENPVVLDIVPNRVSDTFWIKSRFLFKSQKLREVKLIVKSGLNCEYGQVGLKNDYISIAELSSNEPLKVYGIKGESNYSSGTITIEFSREVDKEAVSSFIKVSPAVDYKLEVNKYIVRLKSEHFKPEETYTISIFSGLHAVDASALDINITKTVRMPRLSPLVRFTNEGRYLSNKGNMALELETLNVDSVDVSIYKIYRNNLVYFFTERTWYVEDYIKENIGSFVDGFTLNINSEDNKLSTTTIQLRNYINEDDKGIYRIKVQDRRDHWYEDDLIVMATDIGIVSKRSGDEFVVWANSIKTLNPLYKAKVSLLSSNNQVIAEGETNRQGLVKFENLKDVFTEFTPYLVLVEYEDDFSFLLLNDGRLDFSDFNVDGKANLTEGYETYLYTDRGVYRPGDKVYLTALVRDVNVNVPPELPVNLKIIDPTGNIFTEFAKNTGDGGAAEFEISLPDYVKTGKYTSELYIAGQCKGSIHFNVEEFMPDRLKVEVKTDKEDYASGETAEIKVNGVNLFGPPAEGRAVELSVKMDVVPFKASKYASYSFGILDDEKANINEIVGSGKLDENGEFVFNYSFPDNIRPGNMMKAVFSATVKEEGGRAVTSYKVVNFHPYQTYIGLKRLGEYYASINEPYQIQYVEVDQRGQAVSGSSLVVKVYRIIWHTLWQEAGDGSVHYESEVEEEELLVQRLTPGSGERIFSFTPEDYGRYKVVIENPETNARSSLYFYATGWGYSPWEISNPTKIELELDKTNYQNGELAQIQVKAPFSGKALVTIEREKIYDMQIVEFKQNTGLLAVNVKEDWAPNVYVTVQLIRPLDSVEKYAPLRAYGTIALPVDPSAKRLNIKINTSDEIRPNQTCKVTLEVEEATENTYVTLAAVDEGILQLTNFRTPDPFAFFYGKKMLDVQSYDLYSMVLPEVNTVLSNSSPGGDADRYEDQILRENLNPISVRRVKPVSFWAGPVKLENGQTSIEFDIPQFNGTLRLMAVAFDGSCFGSTQKKVIVRDPIVLTTTYPRFISGTDKFQVPVSIFNGTGGDGEFKLKLEVNGPVEIENSPERVVFIANGKEKIIYFDFHALNATGKVEFTLTAEGNGCFTKETVELSLRPSVPLVKNIFSGSIKPDKPVILNFSPEDWVEGTGKFNLIISPFPSVQYAGSLEYLLQYPYGCAEQTVSKLFPLLYFDELAKTIDPELLNGNSADYYIDQGIFKLQSMQLHDGSFAYWPGGNYSHPWSSIYASHFLIEARKADYTVANHVYDKMLKNLKKVGRSEAYGLRNVQLRVYALYALAIAGEPDLSSMAYIKNHQWDELSDDSRVMLAAAYYYAGRRYEAEKLIPFSFIKTDIKREMKGNFNSQTRSDAIILSVLADIQPDHPAIPSLAKRITDGIETGYWGTTQDNAFALLALGKILKTRISDEFTGKVVINGEEIGTFDNNNGLEISDLIFSKKEISILLSGTGECYYFAEVQGVPESGEVKAYDNGIKVKREYLDRDGKPLDLNNIKQGDLVIAKITITSQLNTIENLAIVDMLPAGLEIENPRLESRARIDWLQDKSYPVTYMDMRDDRLILFTDINYDNYSDDEKTPVCFYYSLRAVSVGEFVLPPIKAECMYEPEVSSISDRGYIRIVK